VVFDSRRSYDSYRPMFHGKRVDVTGYFQPMEDENLVTLTVEDRESAFRILFHEYAHLIVSNVTRNVPVWANEGLAEYYSTFELQPDGRGALIGTVIDDHLATLNHTVLIRLEDLLKIDPGTPLYNEGTRRGVFYAQSWALTHLILLGQPPRVRELNAYLDNLSSGQEPWPAWQAAFGALDMKKGIEDYVRQRLVQAQKPAFSDAIGKVETRTVSLKPAEVQSYLADLQIQMDDLDAAAARLEQVRKLDPSLPALPIELARLARARAGDQPAGQDLHLEDIATPSDWLLAYLAGVVVAGKTLDRDSVPSSQDVAAVHRLLTAAGQAHPPFLNAAGRLAERQSRSRSPSTVQSLRRRTSFSDRCSKGSSRTG